ncbi:hypothetical protein [Rhodococcus sp. WAY2]|uniref:hypothetical protein n=1 Tax=Rhodococcus sp. WAY2 TaxID=2663121 RepID=UPI0013204626|nr:hypothetical protein [Rhodococcus sp. WAY2]QHE73334.1 hypothetical protein GFS60_06993 [Rhodococcus sp. WAY2]
MSSRQTPSGITISSFEDRDGWTPLAFGLTQTQIILSEPDNPKSPVLYMTHFPPDTVLPRHHHESPFCDAVVTGSMWVEDDQTWYHAGTVRHVPPLVVYGPTKSGPNGLTLLEFYAQVEGVPATLYYDSMSPEQVEELERYLAQRPARTRE